MAQDGAGATTDGGIGVAFASIGALEGKMTTRRLVSMVAAALLGVACSTNGSGLSARDGAAGTGTGGARTGAGGALPGSGGVIGLGGAGGSTVVVTGSGGGGLGGSTATGGMGAGGRSSGNDGAATGGARTGMGGAGAGGVVVDAGGAVDGGLLGTGGAPLASGGASGTSRGGAIGQGGVGAGGVQGTGGNTATGSGGKGGGGNGGAGGTGTGALCGGKVCASDEVCCGPPDCGHCINPLTGPNCPQVCTTSACGPTGAPCQDGEICLNVNISMGPRNTITTTCVANPCGTQALACDCAGALCQDASPATQCSQAIPASGVLVCVGGGVCASPDTPIATPSGNRPIAELRRGDWVFSEHHGALVAVPLLEVVRRPVQGHVVIHLVTASGATLDISAPHPTADGRRFSDLQVGDLLDGDPILVREVAAYPHAFTYDILPASSTGTYVAAGHLIGSTLRR
jgi:hypothetical protein